jgi:hypothetical protein
MTGDLDPRRRIYAIPNAAELRAALPAMASRIQGELEALYANPSDPRCGDVALSLFGAQTHVQRLRMAARGDGI